MSFNSSIPQPTDLISQSQSQIQTNFSQSNTAFGIDHTAFDVISNQGKHKKSTYVEQGSNPATSADELSLYSKDLGGSTTLYLRKESNGTVVQMSGQDPTIAASGSTFLPGGIILKWGTGAVASNTAVSFASAFPNNCYNVNVTPTAAGSTITTSMGVKTGSLTTTQFVLLNSGGVVTFYYIAIGN